MAFELSPEAERRAREAFEEALSRSVPAYQMGQLKLFHDDDEKYIRREVERKLYELQLPNGGAKERRVIERLKALAMDRQFDAAGRADYAARLWAAVLPENPRNPGRYYTRHPITLRTNKADWEYYVNLKVNSAASRQWERKWFAELMLEGFPEPISDFVMECLLSLRRSDGTVLRLVKLKNVLGEEARGTNHQGSLILEAKDYAAPEKFRTWCLMYGQFAWGGNQVALQKLHMDVNRLSAWRVVNQIDYCGWHEVSREKGEMNGLWLFDDCAYAGGKTLRADKDGIFWLDSEGYYLSQRGRESNFLQLRPRMKPEVTLEEILGKRDWEQAKNPLLEEGEQGDSLLRDFYREVCSKFFDTTGGHEGWLAMGAMFAYAAAPELFAEYGLFPGLWIHGQMGSGKTKLMEWLMRVWGFRMQAGIGLLKATAVGILQESENYSNLPLWLDEFRASEVDQAKMSILRDSYNRQPAAKWTPDGIQRVMRTSYVVSGESTSSDAAARSRYPHIQVSRSKRLANHLEWFTEHADKFYVFGRVLLERRGEFVKWVQDYLEKWLKAPEMAEVNEREKMVHGIDYAGWMAMNALLESHTSDELKAFKGFVAEHAKGSAADVTSETNINVFWMDLITAAKAEAIPLNCFKVSKSYPAPRPEAPRQGAWASYSLYIDPEATIAALQQYLVKGRGAMTLRRTDLRDQLSRNAYWIPGKLRKRMSSGDATSAVWGFELDKHPLGYLPATDEEWNYFLMNPEEGDPRKGPLFGLVQLVENAQRRTTVEN